MRMFDSPLFSTLCRKLSGRGIAALRISLLLLTFAPILPVAAQQAGSSSASKTAAHRKAVSRAHGRKAAKPSAKPAAAGPAAAAPSPVAALSAPPKPDWPVNNKPAPAAIAWNAAGLHIEAANSSLQQILKEVSTLTGATVEGLTTDERVYGVFGPAPARDVLTRLFDGSHYNLLLIGDQGQGTPRRIVLSPRDGKSSAPGAKATKQNDDEDDDIMEPDDQPQEQEQQQPPQPPVVRNSFGQSPQRPQQFNGQPQNAPQ